MFVKRKGKPTSRVTARPVCLSLNLSVVTNRLRRLTEAASPWRLWSLRCRWRSVMSTISSPMEDLSSVTRETNTRGREVTRLWTKAAVLAALLSLLWSSPWSFLQKLSSVEFC